MGSSWPKWSDIGWIKQPWLHSWTNFCVTSAGPWFLNIFGVNLCCRWQRWFPLCDWIWHTRAACSQYQRRWFQWKSCNTDQWIQPRESQTMPARHHGDPNFSNLSEPMEKQDFEPWSQHQDSRNSSVSASPETIKNTVRTSLCDREDSNFWDSEV